MLKDWFVGTTRRIKGQLIERRYGYFRVLVTGKIIHATTMAELESKVK